MTIWLELARAPAVSYSGIMPLYVSLCVRLLFLRVCKFLPLIDFGLLVCSSAKRGFKRRLSLLAAAQIYLRVYLSSFNCVLKLDQIPYLLLLHSLSV